MTDGTSKLVTLRPTRPVAPHDIDPPVSTSERDGFIAETAVQLDQLQASILVLQRAVAGLADRRAVDDLADRLMKIEEVAGQDHRLHAFLQVQQRTRDDKLDEVVRMCRDLKARLDRIEARSAGDYHAYTTFEAVSRKLGELERPRRAERRWLFR